jgi:hypothetical protein
LAAKTTSRRDLDSQGGKGTDRYKPTILVSARAGLLQKIRVTLDETVNLPIIGQQIQIRVCWLIVRDANAASLVTLYYEVIEKFVVLIEWGVHVLFQAMRQLFGQDPD